MLNMCICESPYRSEPNMALFSSFTLEQGDHGRSHDPRSEVGQGDGRAAPGRGAALRGRVGGRVDAHDAARVPQRRGREKVTSTCLG